jgi:hypothetical protein
MGRPGAVVQTGLLGLEQPWVAPRWGSWVGLKPREGARVAGASRQGGRAWGDRGLKELRRAW